VQCGQREAASSIASRQYGQVRAAGAGAAGRMNALLIRQTMNPMIRKSITAPAKSPTRNFTGPTFHVAVRQSPPGTAYQYANVGYTLLSMIASKAGGRPFDDLLRDEVLRPLGLTHTVPERDGRRVPGRARGYVRTDEGLRLDEQKTIDIVGAGDIVTTADDLARFDAAFDGDRFLPAPIRDAMLTPHVQQGNRVVSLGYGWFLRTTEAGREMQYHVGDGAGFRAFHYRFPKERLAIIILSNVGEHDVPWLAPLRDRIVEAADVR